MYAQKTHEYNVYGIHYFSSVAMLIILIIATYIAMHYE